MMGHTDCHIDDMPNDDEVLEVTTKGDEMANSLLIHRILTPHRALELDRWLRRNIFYTTCISGVKQCTIIIDNRSTENLMSQEMVANLE